MAFMKRRCEWIKVQFITLMTNLNCRLIRSVNGFQPDFGGSVLHRKLSLLANLLHFDYGHYHGKYGCSRLHFHYAGLNCELFSYR